MKLYTVVFLVLLITSCKKSQKQIINNEFELFTIGYAEVRDTVTWQTIGASRYMKVCDNDSFHFKISTVPNAITGELETKSYTYKLPLDSLLKQQMAGAIKTIENKGFKDGRFPNNKLEELSCYCGPHYILTYKDSLGKHRTFTFIENELHDEINQVLNSFWGRFNSLDKIKKSNTTIKINTDSIASHYFYFLSKHGVEKPPPLKSTVKFEPPPITAEK